MKISKKDALAWFEFFTMLFEEEETAGNEDKFPKGCISCLLGTGLSAIMETNKYTNGISAMEETLKALGEAGLDEIRFNLGASNCSNKVIENIKIAKKYIKEVGIETLMIPEFFEGFLKKKQAILDTKLNFINCAELHLNENKIDNYG